MAGAENQIHPEPDPASSKSQEEQLTELLASASHQYALKSYVTASDLYAQAAELQDDINGEMNPANADLLYAYGRCLHHLAVSKSDVLGGKVAGPSEGGGAKSGKKRKRENDPGVGSSSSAAAGSVALDAKTSGDVVAEKVVEKAVEDREGVVVKEKEEQIKTEGKPFFQISGDDQEWTSEEEAEGDIDEDVADADAEDEEDDFAIAYEILDTARILLTRQIDELADTDTEHVRPLKERLADTHDLQAEISLENERFSDAIIDSQSSLSLKRELYDETDGLVSEAHYKLSLALEFASVTTPKDENGAPIEGAEQTIDQKLRDEAAHEMEAAIKCTKLRIEKETKAMASLSGDELKRKQAQKKDFEEVITDMEQRLEDLRNPPVSMNSAAGPAGAAMDNNPLGGILGEMLGESPQALKARIEEAAKGAHDLSGLVKHKKKPQPQTAEQPSGPNGDVKGKRKVEIDDDGDELARDSKRLKSPAV